MSLFVNTDGDLIMECLFEGLYEVAFELTHVELEVLCRKNIGQEAHWMLRKLELTIPLAILAADSYKDEPTLGYCFEGGTLEQYQIVLDRIRNSFFLNFDIDDYSHWNDLERQVVDRITVGLRKIVEMLEQITRIMK